MSILGTIGNVFFEKLLKLIDLRVAKEVLLDDGLWLVSLAAAMTAAFVGWVGWGYIASVLLSLWPRLPTTGFLDFILFLLLLATIGAIAYLLVQGYNRIRRSSTVFFTVLALCISMALMTSLRAVYLANDAAEGIHQRIADRTSRSEVLAWATRIDPKNNSVNFAQGVLLDLKNDVSAIDYFEKVEHYDIRLIDRILHKLPSRGSDTSTIESRVLTQTNSALINLARLYLSDERTKRQSKKEMASGAIGKVKLNGDVHLEYRKEIAFARIQLSHPEGQKPDWDAVVYDSLQYALLLAQQANLDERKRVYAYCLGMENNHRLQSESAYKGPSEAEKCETIQRCGAYAQADIPEEINWRKTAETRYFKCLPRVSSRENSAPLDKENKK